MHAICMFTRELTICGILSILNKISVFACDKVKFFEALKPLKIQCSALQSRLELVAMEMSEKDDELANAMKVCIQSYLLIQRNQLAIIL